MITAMPLLGGTPLPESTPPAPTSGGEGSIDFTLSEAEFEVVVEAVGLSTSPEVQKISPASTQIAGRALILGDTEVKTPDVKATRNAEADVAVMDLPNVVSAVQSNTSAAASVTRPESVVPPDLRNTVASAEPQSPRTPDSTDVVPEIKNRAEAIPMNAPVDQAIERVKRAQPLGQVSPEEATGANKVEKAPLPQRTTEVVQNLDAPMTGVSASVDKVVGDNTIAQLDQRSSEPTTPRNASAFEASDKPTRGTLQEKSSDVVQTRQVSISADEPKADTSVTISISKQFDTQNRTLADRTSAPEGGAIQDGSKNGEVNRVATQKPEIGASPANSARRNDWVSDVHRETSNTAGEARSDRGSSDSPKVSVPDVGRDTPIVSREVSTHFNKIQSRTAIEQGKTPSADASLPTDRGNPAEKTASVAASTSTLPVAIVNEPIQVEFEPLTVKYDTDGELKAASANRGIEPAMARSEPPRPVAHQLADAVRTASSGTIEVKLAPEELGRVKLSLTPSEAGLTITVLADRPETLDLIRRNIDVFAQDLRQQGHQNLSFQFGQQDRNRQNWNEPNDHPEKTEILSTEQRPYAQRAIPSLATINGRLDLRI